MIRFIHTADFHFGVENYGRIDAQTGIHTRLLDFHHALSFCIDRAIAEQVDFFLFSGDAYKTAYPTPTQLRLLCECFLRLFKAQIPLVILVGNHDNPASFGKAHALELFGQLPLAGFYVISKPGNLVLQTKQGPVHLVGIPWPSRSMIALNNQSTISSSTDVIQYISQALASIIEGQAKSLDPTIPAILMAHLTVSSGLFSGSEKRALSGTDPVLMPSQLAMSPFDYIALGHLHRHQNLGSSEGIPIVYPGSIERIDFGERHEEKGFCLVTIHDKNKATYEFIKTPIRRFVQIETHLEGLESQTDQIIHELRKEAIEDAIVKIIYHVPAHKKDRVDTLAIQQACLAAQYLVGIFPVRVPEIRERRTCLRVGMELAELLEAYFQSKPEYRQRRATLIQKALDLEHEPPE